MKTIKTWNEAENLINSIELLDDFAINIKFDKLNFNARTEKLISHKNYIRGYLSSEHKGICINDITNSPENITLPNGTEFIYYYDSNKITVNYYERSEKMFFVGLSDNLSNEFWQECEVHTLKPTTKKTSLSYIGFNENNTEYKWLSNKSSHSIKLKSITYENVESALKSIKSNPFTELNSFPSPNSIRVYMPMLHTMRGSGSSVYDGLKREHLNITVKKMLNKKLKQHPELIKKLIETKDMVLFHDLSEKRKPISSDYYWGAVLENNELMGYNNLGKIWMEIRNRIKNKLK